MIRHLLFILSVILLIPHHTWAQQGYLEVTAPGNRQAQLTIAAPLALAGSADSTVAKEVADVLRFDLTLAGLFSVAETPPSVMDKGGIRSGEFSFAPWKATGSDFLIKSGYTVAGSTLTVECRLFDLDRGREMTAKRYSGPAREVRRMVHTFADEVLRAVTGEAGPFTGKIAFVSTATGNKEIYVMDFDGQNVVRLTKNGSINLNPDFSPDGRELVFTSYQKGNPDLYRRDIATGAETRISARRGVNITAAWAPDGKKIALAMSKDGDSSIYVIDRDGKELSRLTRDDAISVSPSWSPDGKRLAFVSDRTGKPQIFTMNADGSNVERLTRNGSYNVSPRWSPKGDRIVYCRQNGHGFQIYVINADGSNDTQLTSEGSNEHPRWSPDGRFITFSSKRGGKETIFVMRSDGKGETSVYQGKGQSSHPSWSPRW